MRFFVGSITFSESLGEGRSPPESAPATGVMISERHQLIPGGLHPA